MIAHRRSFLAAGALLLLAACGPPRETERPSASARAFTSNDISVATRGAGPDVILIHGLAGHTGVWDDVADALDDRYRLHLVQMHGFGGVPRASADSLVSAAVAREVARYIRDAGLERPALIGHSMGGSIAMMVAARNPGLASRVMAVDIIPFMGVMFGQPDASVESLRPIADQMREQILQDDMFTQMVGTMARGEADRQRLVQYAVASDRRTVAHAMHELLLTDMRPELPRIDVPLTVVYVQDESVPMTREQFDASMRELYSGAPRATLVRIEDSKHYIQLDQPERFVAEVDAFMQR